MYVSDSDDDDSDVDDNDNGLMMMMMIVEDHQMKQQFTGQQFSTA